MVDIRWDEAHASGVHALTPRLTKVALQMEAVSLALDAMAEQLARIELRQKAMGHLLRKLCATGDRMAAIDEDKRLGDAVQILLDLDE
jgi:hypothetical protein